MRYSNAKFMDDQLTTIKFVPSVSAAAVVTNISVRWVTLQFTDQWIILLVKCSN